MFRQKIKKSIHKIAAAIMSALLLVYFCLPIVPQARAFADGEFLSMDETSVADDLSGLDYAKFPKIEAANPTLYSLMEYCYSDDPFKLDNYALYLYVYNPSCTQYALLTGASSVNMASAYEKKSDGSFAQNDAGALRITEYQSLPLKYCGAMDGDKENLFVKFRVMNVSNVLSNVKQMEKEGYTRRYDVAEIQLFEVGAQNATGYPATSAEADEGGRTFFYTGYAKGYGTGAETQSTLKCEYDNLAVVNLAVHHTSYKTGVSSLGRGHQNELHTVYFSVDNRFLEAYGRLQKIAAQWYEYKLTPSIVASAEIYEKLLPYVGVDIGVNAGDSARSDLPYKIRHEADLDVEDTITGVVPLYDYTWNKSTVEGTAVWSTYVETVIKLLFRTPKGENVNDYTVKGADVLEAAKTYAGVTSGETLPIKDGTVPADCFLSEVDEGRTAGYNTREFDADCVNDEWDMLSYDDTHEWYESWADFGLFNANKPENTDETLLGVKPIYVIEAEDMKQTDDEELSKGLLIGETDVSAFRDFYEKATKADQSVILFRYAVTDYYAVPLDVYDLEAKKTISSARDIQAELRQGTAFLDFEIISLTFNKDGVLTVLGVVCSPIDMLGDYTPALVASGCDDADIKKFVGILIVVFVIVVVIWVIKLIRGARTDYMIRSTYRNTRRKK